MPIYQLLGGACRTAVPCHDHAGGNELPELEDSVCGYLREGYPVLHCHPGLNGGGGFISADQAVGPKDIWPDTKVFDDKAYLHAIPRIFEYLRRKLGMDPILTYDVHGNLWPQSAVDLSKRLEQHRLSFLGRAGARTDRLLPAYRRPVHDFAGHARAALQPALLAA